MINERPKTKLKTKRFFLKVTFVVLVLSWLGVLSMGLVFLDHNYKKRILKLEHEIEQLKAAATEAAKPH